MTLRALKLAAIAGCCVCTESAVEPCNASVEACGDDSEQDIDSTALFQTYVRVASKSEATAKEEVPIHVIEKMWRWVAQASKEDFAEPAQRSHKDFIAAALLMTCVLPWSAPRLSGADGSHTTAMSRLSRTLSSSQSLRYLCVLLLWLKHYVFKGQHIFLELMLVLVGIVFDFAGQQVDHEEDMWKRLADCVPQRFARLYPLYALHVFVCYLVFFSSPCTVIIDFLDGNMLPFYVCGLGAWASSLLFACYLVVTLLSSSHENIESSSVAMLNAGCVAMIVLPRTLAAPVHGPWLWSEEKAASLQANPDAALFELFFARRSLLLALAHFFFGLVLARICLFMMPDSVSLDADVSESCKELQVEMPGSISAQRGRAVSRSDEDLWREFEAEAQRDMVRAFSVNKAVEVTYSPRSNASD